MKIDGNIKWLCIQLERIYWFPEYKATTFQVAFQSSHGVAPWFQSLFDYWENLQIQWLYLSLKNIYIYVYKLNNESKHVHTSKSIKHGIMAMKAWQMSNVLHSKFFHVQANRSMQTLHGPQHSHIYFFLFLGVLP